MSSLLTSPSAPDLEEVRTWLERMIKALKFAELIVAVLALLVRMRDINFELTKQLAQFRRARPRSETLERHERQLLLPLADLVLAPARPGAPGEPPKRRRKKRQRGACGGRAALPAHLPRV